jgi:hypothetical protein
MPYKLALILILWPLITSWEPKHHEVARVAFNPVNKQDLVVNRLTGRAIAYHGQEAKVLDWNGKEHGFYRDGKWCSLWRSINLKEWERRAK